MLPDFIDFNSLPWESPLAGIRFKAYREGGKQIRLAEFTPEFIESGWCEKGHIGLVLEGTLEVRFKGHVVVYPQGSGFFILGGATTAHKARCLTPLVRLVLVEDA